MLRKLFALVTVFLLTGPATPVLAVDRLAAGYKPPFGHSLGHIHFWYSNFSGTDPHVWTTLIIIVLLAAGIFLARVRKQQKAQEVGQRNEQMLEDLAVRRQEILDQITALDEQKAKPAGYQVQREKLKKELLNVTRRIKRLTSGE